MNYTPFLEGGRNDETFLESSTNSSVIYDERFISIYNDIDINFEYLILLFWLIKRNADIWFVEETANGQGVRKVFASSRYYLGCFFSYQCFPSDCLDSHCCHPSRIIQSCQERCWSNEKYSRKFWYIQETQTSVNEWFCIKTVILIIFVNERSLFD